MIDGKKSEVDVRRVLVGVIALCLIGVWAIATFGLEQSGGSSFAAMASGRIGLVMSALWFAWPSLRRPANWLPPGIAVLCVVALAVIAAQPRLVIVAVPALGVLLLLATVVRAFKR